MTSFCIMMKKTLNQGPSISLVRGINLNGHTFILSLRRRVFNWVYHKERRPLTVIQGRQADLRQMHRILDLLYYFAIHYQCRRQLSHMTYSYPRKVSRPTITNQKFFLRSSKILSIMIRALKGLHFMIYNWIRQGAVWWLLNGLLEK